MSLRSYAENLLRQAELRLEAARLFLERDASAYVVRQSQECAELALKAALRLQGIEYPKEHDVGDVLREQASTFPEPFRRNVDDLAEISKVLYASRIPSMYGEEALGKGPGDLFTPQEAREAVERAAFVVEKVRTLFGG
jgi:HEPN domain-containing protein